MWRRCRHFAMSSNRFAGAGREHPSGHVETTMRVMIINTDYGPFLKSFYDTKPSSFFKRLFSTKPSTQDLPYAEQIRLRNETLFAGSDFYSRNFQALGHEAWEFHVNNGPLQTVWL